MLDGFKRALDIDVGETTADNQFTLEATRCIGACGLAPVVTVDEDVYGTTKTEDIANILAKYMVEDN
jgi:NADH:ubiquinone oxidoreductase subunit E